jgi:hypothetical protein
VWVGLSKRHRIISMKVPKLKGQNSKVQTSQAYASTRNSINSQNLDPLIFDLPLVAG